MKPLTLQTRKETGIFKEVQKSLLICGILSSLYYVAINIIVPTHYPGYSLSSQTVSELSAIDAPTRTLWVFLCIFYSLLVVVFGFGIWLSSSRNRKLRVVSILMIAYGVIGFFWPPMHRREVLVAGGGTLTDTLHIVFSIVTVGLMTAMIGFGAASAGKLFRFYSIITLIVLLAFGILTGLDSSGLAQNLPTPWIGVWERVNIGVYMLWVIVLSGRLLRQRTQ